MNMPWSAGGWFSLISAPAGIAETINKVRDKTNGFLSIRHQPHH
jgi:hypothetical protein